MGAVSNAVWNDLLDTAAAVSRALTLPVGAGTLPGARVVVRKTPGDRGLTLPALVISPGGREDLRPRGDYEDTQISYPVLLTHVFAGNQAAAVNVDELNWRQQLIDAFLDLPRPEVTSAEVVDCRIDPSPGLDLSLFAENLDVGGLLLWFDTWRSRGRT